MVQLVDDLICDFRSDVFDRPDIDEDGQARDTLWSHEDVMRYLNDAVAQWAADTLAYRRSMLVPLVTGQAIYSLPFEVIEIVRAEHHYADGQRGRLLSVFNMQDGYLQDDYGLFYFTPFDLDRRSGPARGVTLDTNPLQLRVYPVPDGVPPGAVHINAVVYPQQLVSGMPLPTNNRQDRHLWLLWMKKLAYAKQDADTLDLRRSKEFEAEYVALSTTRKYEHDRAARNGGVIQSRW